MATAKAEMADDGHGNINYMGGLDGDGEDGG